MFVVSQTTDKEIERVCGHGIEIHFTSTQSQTMA
jgi:hypothetical protein